MPKCLATGLDIYQQETNGLSLPCYSRKELSDLWDKCFFGPAQREEFTPAFDGMCDIIRCAANQIALFPPSSFPGFSPTCPGRVGEKPGNEVVFPSRLGSKTKVLRPTVGGVWILDETY